MAAPTTVLTVNKRFTYRGNAEDYSNTYMFTGPTPSSSSAWRALLDALVVEEKKMYVAACTVIGGYGYDKVPAKGDHAIYSVDLTVSPNTPVAGTFAGGGQQMPGDAAVWIRWGLDRLSSPGGKRIYLRKYFHPAQQSTTVGKTDEPIAAWITAANAFGSKMWDGTFLDGRRVTDRLGTAVIGSATGTYITTRTLKRRSKRPEG